jgi:hypothetical protein
MNSLMNDIFVDERRNNRPGDPDTVYRDMITLLNEQQYRWYDSAERWSQSPNSRNYWTSKQWQDFAVDFIKKAKDNGLIFRALPPDWEDVLRNAVNQTYKKNRAFNSRKYGPNLVYFQGRSEQQMQVVLQQSWEQMLEDFFNPFGFGKILLHGTVPNSPVVQEGFAEDVVNPEEIDEDIVEMKGSGDTGSVFSQHHLEPYLQYIRRQYADIDSRVIQDIETAIQKDKVVFSGSGRNGDVRFPDVVYRIKDPPLETRSNNDEMTGGGFLAKGADTCVFDPFIPQKILPQGLDFKRNLKPGVEYVSRIVQASSPEIALQGILKNVLDDKPFTDVEKGYFNLAVSVGDPEPIPKKDWKRCVSGRSILNKDQKDLKNLITQKQEGGTLSEYLNDVAGQNLGGPNGHLMVYTGRMRYDIGKIMEVMIHLNRYRFVHGDLHPQNIQLLGPNIVEYFFVVFDFGRAIASAKNAAKLMLKYATDDKYDKYVQHKWPQKLVRDKLDGHVGELATLYAAAKFDKYDKLSVMIYLHDFLSLYGICEKYASALQISKQELETCMVDVVDSIQVFTVDKNVDELVINLQACVTSLFGNTSDFKNAPPSPILPKAIASPKPPTPPVAPAQPAPPVAPAQPAVVPAIAPRKPGSTESEKVSVTP